MRWERLDTRAIESAVRNANGDLAVMISFLAMLRTPAFIKDKSGRLLFLNRAAEQLARMPAHDAIGKTMAHVFGTSDLAKVRSHDQRVLRHSAARVAVYLEQGSPLLTALEFPFEDSEGDRLLGGILVSADA